MGKLPYEIPDWNKWKVEDVPELKKVQDRLAKKGLRDPWLRNEVWRYQHYIRGASWSQLLLRGFGWGTAAFVVAVGLEKLLWKEESHGNGGEHH